MVESILVIVYGPAILSSALHVFHRHANVSLGVVGALVVLLGVYVVRKVFDRKRGVGLPVEDESSL
jgi:hypothetical protein